MNAVTVQYKITICQNVLNVPKLINVQNVLIQTSKTNNNN